MIIFALLIGVLNMIGGRFSDLISGAGSGRLIFRGILPGVLSAFFAAEQGFDAASVFYATAAVLLGGLFWFPWGWSFDEIYGAYDATKYPAWIQRVGLFLLPAPFTPGMNRLRGVIMKGLRGLFDVITFGLLSLRPDGLHLVSLAFLVGTAWFGVIYYLVGLLTGRKSWSVAVAEFVYGAWRGALIAGAIVC